MAIPANQIGNDPQSKLLWQISKQLEKQTQVISNSGGGGSFDGQLTQGGADVSNTNPLPVEFAGTITASAIADSTFQDSTGQIFVYRDNGVDVPIAYKIPEWTVYTPIGAVSATSSPLTNYALEADGNLESINGKLPALSGGKVPVTDPTALPLPTGAATSDNQIDGSQKGQIVDAAGNVITSTTISGKQRLDVNLASAAAPNATAPSIGDMVGGTDGTNFRPLAMDAAGNLKVNTAASSFSYSTNNSTNGNSTAVSLGTGTSWNGTIENTINQSYAIIGVVSNQNVTLTISQFLDVAGTTKDVADKTFAITANVPYSLPLAVLGNYIRLSITNSSGSTASVIVDTYYGILPVAPDTLTQLGNFKNSINEVGGVTVPATGILVTGRTGQPVTSPTVTASSAYTAGNIVGGLMTFSNCFATGLTSGVLQSIVIKSKSVQTVTFKLYIFSQQPTNTTWTDKTAPAINALDLPYLIDMFIFAAPDSGLGTMTIYTQDGLGKSIANTASGQNLWGVLVTTGTPTFTSTSDISVTLGILQD